MIVGSGFDDALVGGAGVDTASYAGSGLGRNDRLYGEAGNDTFNGGPGTDLCAQGVGTGRKVACER